MPPSCAPTFGRYLHRLRITRGLTQEQLAERVGVHPTYIAKLEAGSRLPSLGTLVRLARALDYPPSQLVSVLDPAAADHGDAAVQRLADELAELLDSLLPEDLELARDIVDVLRRHRQRAKRGGD